MIGFCSYNLFDSAVHSSSSVVQHLPDIVWTHPTSRYACIEAGGAKRVGKMAARIIGIGETEAVVCGRGGWYKCPYLETVGFAIGEVGLEEVEKRALSDATVCIM